MRFLIWVAYAVALVHGWVPHNHSHVVVQGVSIHCESDSPGRGSPLEWHHTHSLSVQENLAGSRVGGAATWVFTEGVATAALPTALNWHSPIAHALPRAYRDRNAQGLQDCKHLTGPLRGPPSAPNAGE